jgi:hypothetical protein
MKSIGLDVQQYLDNGLLSFHASRPTLYGLKCIWWPCINISSQFKPEHGNIRPYYQPHHYWVGGRCKINAGPFA